MGVLRRIIWWDFERASWQWDLLCLAIVIFIFFTPKAWFEKGEKLATQPEKILVQAVGLPGEKEALQRKVREILGRPDARIEGFEEKQDSNGQKFYEIIIR